jgi:hypothetical protein
MRWPGMIAFALAGAAAPMQVQAHPGGLNAQGCHNNRKTGDYHCHGGGSGGPSRPKAMGLLSFGGGSFANCAAARAAGAAPVRAGDPGYSRKLDRDGDGIGCE